MRDQRINELRDWLFQPAKEDETGVYIWSRENDTEDISAAYALRTSGQRFVPVLSKTDGTLAGDVVFSSPPRPGDSGIIYVPRLSMHLNLRDNYREDGQVVEVHMPFLTSGWGEHDLALRISPEGAEKLDVRLLARLLCLGINASIDREDLWEFEVKRVESAVQERMMVVAGDALATERRDFSERLTRHINTMVAPSSTPAGVYHVNTDMGLLRIEAGTLNAPLDVWGAEVAIPDHTGAYGERIEELAHEADGEGFSINEKSRADFWDFVASPPTEHIAEVTLSDSGLLWASWHRAGGGVIEVEFLGGGQCVVHGDSTSADEAMESGSAHTSTMERAREIVAQTCLRSAEEAYS